MVDVTDAVGKLGRIEQKDLVCDLAGIIAPYGSVDTDVVAPAVFADLSARLVDAPSAASALPTEQECQRVVERFSDEPGGAGFFAFGAVVHLLYACQAVRGDPDGAVNCTKRFLDLLGAADDDGQVGLYDESLRYLAAPSPNRRLALVTRVRAHAEALV